MKSQIPNNKFQKNVKENNRPLCLIYMSGIPIYDLEERTFQFAKKTAVFCRRLPKSISNTEYARQIIRASGSIGANYIEANESLGRKDFMMRLKICRKEAKEAVYWSRLIVETNSDAFGQEGECLKNEAIELKKIFSSIISKYN